MIRHNTLFDQLIQPLDHILRTVGQPSPATQRPNPMSVYDKSPELSAFEKRHVGGMMRINHTGEVCAQALYLGQALTTKNPDLKAMFIAAATEEQDHLNWCQARIKQLDTHTSRLNIAWYTGSLALGAFASFCGDRWSLGFLQETEEQVVTHLSGHLKALPEQDFASKAIIGQMISDEAEHAATAVSMGAATLPRPIKYLMKGMAKVMTTVTYRF